MRFLKLLLILPVLGYGGIKAYIWYDIKNNVDDAIVSVAPFVDITYESIFSSLLDGVVGITGVVIRPKMTSDEFTIKEMNFSAPNILDIFLLESRFKDREFPEYIGFEMKSVNIDVNSEIFVMLDDMRAQAAESQTPEDPLLIERLDALGCGDIEKFGINEFSAMGYNPLNLDIALNMAFEQDSKQVNVGMSIKDRDLYSTNFTVQTGFDPNQMKSAGLQPFEPEISRIKIEHNDAGYYKLRNKYCAEQNGGSIEQYVNANVAQLAAELGAVFPKKVVDAYRRFMTSGGRFTVSLNPAEATMLSGLEFYKTADVLDILGMEIVINGANIDLGQIDWDAGAGKTTARKNDTLDIIRGHLSNPTVARVSPPAKPGSEKQNSAKTRKYRKVQKSQLPRYIGKNIQVETSIGKRRQGQLESVDEERIHILMKFGNGEFSFPVKLDDILQARVYL
ncbi:MAG TPA: hypothetical protein ENK04_08760 [Gammaproteobacteria bacterium]|nr:hypothetical protein [Gammaproteobacteria bacterium]